MLFNSTGNTEMQRIFHEMYNFHIFAKCSMNITAFAKFSMNISISLPESILFV